MADKTGIEWTDATWNPVRGCAIVSPACTNCYAMRQAHRSSGAGGAYEGLTKVSKGGPVWTGAIRTVPELLDQPLHWRRPRRIFVNSMSDLFHPGVPFGFINRVWEVMERCPQHTFQILTKRAERMHEYCADVAGRPLPNVWLGVSVEDQRRAEERIPVLMRTPAGVRWISAEPLLGPLDLRGLWTHCPVHDFASGFCVCPCIDRRELDWVVVGGESGPGARPMSAAWARALRDQCAAASVPFFFKQWGAWSPCPMKENHQESTAERQVDGVWMLKLGKKLSGRALDGRVHDDYPA